MKIKNFCLVLAIFNIAIALSTSQIFAQEDFKTIKISDARLIGIERGLESVDYWNVRIRPGDEAAARRQINELNRISSRLERLSNVDEAEKRWLQGQCKSLLESLNEKASPVNSKNSNAKKTNQSKSQIKSKPSTREKQTMETKTTGSQMTLEEARQVVKKMEAKYENELVVPEARKMMKSGQMTLDDVTYFVEGMKKLDQNIAKDVPVLQKMEQLGVGSHLLKRLTGDYGIASEMKREKKNLKIVLDQRIRSGYEHAKSAAGMDIEKNKYSFVTESVKSNYLTRMNNTIETLRNASLIETALEMEPTWSPKLADVERYLTTYQTKVGQASRHDELPESVNSQELTKIAKKVLAVKKYEVGDVEKMIVNSKKTPRERIEVVWRNDRFERIVRVWEEFQVCTVEREDGKRMVYFNNVRKFSKAPNPTPIDQWILGERWKSGEIDPQKVK
ncbi:MAG: hypothetical protein AAF939_11890 [Planctomycetota bacterium]